MQITKASAYITTLKSKQDILSYCYLHFLYSRFLLQTVDVPYIYTNPTDAYCRLINKKKN